MFSGAACAPGHSKKTAATASAQERKDRGVLKGRCIIKSIGALKKEVDATKACGHRAWRGFDKIICCPKGCKVPSHLGLRGKWKVTAAVARTVSFLSLVLHRVIVWSKAEGSARANGSETGAPSSALGH
jgi:hypothetical protein